MVSVLLLGMLAVVGEGWYRVGYRYLERGDTARALRSFRRAVQVDPSYAPAWAVMVHLFRARGQRDSARAVLQRWIQEDPARGWPRLGVFFLDEGKLDSARFAFEQTLREDSLSVRGHLGLAEIWVKSGELTRAEAYLKDRLKVSPHPAYRAALGVFYAEQERCREAIPLLEEAFTHYRQEERVVLSLGTCLWKEKKYRALLNMVDALSALPPDLLPRVRKLEAQAAEALQDHERARKVYRWLCEHTPQRAPCLKAADLWMKVDPDIAERLATEVLNRHPTSEQEAIALSLLGDVWEVRAQQEARDGRWEAAFRAHTRALNYYREAARAAPERSRWRRYAEAQSRRVTRLQKKAYRKWKHID